MKAWATLLFLLLFCVLSILPQIKENTQQQQILQRADQAHTELFESASSPTSPEQFGTVYASNSAWRFSTTQLQREVKKLPAADRHRFYTWSDSRHVELTGSASGVDSNTWFANSFLVGFLPFETESIWEPLATLSLRKGYVLDHQLYGPNKSEIWQNSQQGFMYSRGDCEDHAIVLADWLIALGHEARVVLGKHRGQGHAWVVLFKEGKEYILEATTKRRPKSIHDFELAALATDYHPLYQFDRDNYWVNANGILTTRYQGDHWHLRSKFLRTSRTVSAG